MSTIKSIGWLICFGLVVFTLEGYADKLLDTGLHGEAVLDVSADRVTLSKKGRLLYPFANPDVVEKYYCFGLHPWDEHPHNGIDMVPFFVPIKHPKAYDPFSSFITGVSRTTEIIAAADGQVKKVLHLDNPHSHEGLGQWILVIIQINDYWHYSYSFEPKTLKPELQALQEEAIRVRVGQSIRRGETVGHLVIGDGGGSQYPHIHFSLFYKSPDISYADMLEDSKTYQVHNGKNVPQSLFESSHIFGETIFDLPERDLGIKPTFFCVYHFSTAQAKKLYDAKPAMGTIGNICPSVCAYQSSSGSCGTGTPDYLGEKI